MSESVRIVMGVTIAESLMFLGTLPELLNDADWEVHLVSNPGPLPSAITCENVNFHELPMARKPRILLDLRSLFLWLKLLKNVRPTIAYMGTPKASLLGLLAARLLRVGKRVYVLHGLRLETTRGPYRWLLYLLEQFTASCATHILAVSHSLAAKYLELGLCDSGKISVLGSGSSHGVDLERFQPKPAETVERKRKQLGLAQGVPVLGFVGRFSRDKGAQALLATREKLLKSGIDHELLIAGSVENFQNTFDELSSYGRQVKYAGEVSNVEDLYPLMTMLLLPTKREGFPNVVLEAGASGVPTVSRSVTGTIDSILDDKTGILVDAGSDHAFAEAVKASIGGAEKLTRLGKAARKRAIQEFDQKHVCERHVKYLMKLVS